uniref:Uncharacterized protein n=1 Tax=Anolis carolinensis TaxID=28377 RepID=A0A803TNN8_ANOCA
MSQNKSHSLNLRGRLIPNKQILAVVPNLWSSRWLGFLGYKPRELFSPKPGLYSSIYGKSVFTPSILQKF